MSREKVLLLGGGGFIGNSLAWRLKRKKASVHILGRHDDLHVT